MEAKLAELMERCRAAGVIVERAGALVILLSPVCASDTIDARRVLGLAARLPAGALALVADQIVLRYVIPEGRAAEGDQVVGYLVAQTKTLRAALRTPNQRTHAEVFSAFAA